MGCQFDLVPHSPEKPWLNTPYKEGDAARYGFELDEEHPSRVSSSAMNSAIALAVCNGH